MDPRLFSFAEPLEARIAPASLLNPKTLVFTDVDGDQVRIVFSRPVFTGTAEANLALANLVFQFNAGDVGQGAAEPQQLQLIDFTKFPVIAGKGSSVNGVSFTISSTAADGGDGLVDIGAVRATGVALGKVVIDGDLGQIDAGVSNLKVAIKSLAVNSLGVRGTATQIQVETPTADNPAPDLVSTITGELTNLRVLTDVKDARVRVVDGKNVAGQVTTLANLKNVVIGGSLIGRAAVEAASDDTGVIESERGIGSVKIGTTAAQGIVGGGGLNSGRVAAGSTLGKLVVSGDIAGGGGANSGLISSVGDVKSLMVGGSMVGGDGDESGRIRIFGNMDVLAIQGGIIAGEGDGSAVVSALGAIRKITLSGDIDARTEDAGLGSAGIFANGLPAVHIGGGIFGGSGAVAGFIESGRDVGKAVIAESIVGGSGDGGAALVAQGMVKSLMVQGDLLGADGRNSGVVRSGLDAQQPGTMGAVTILGRIEGGMGFSSGNVSSGGDLKRFKAGNGTVGIAGGGGDFSGSLVVTGRVGSIDVLGSVSGGVGLGSGSILVEERTASSGEVPGSIARVKISGTLRGGEGERSGAIRADGDLGKLIVGGIQGGSGEASATVQTGLGLFAPGDMSFIRVNGVISVAGETPGSGSASLYAGGHLESIFVSGAITGGSVRVGDHAGTAHFGGNVSDFTFTARGQALQGTGKDLAIGKVAILGQVSGTSFLAGYDLSGAPVNPDAQIGVVTVRGDWTASNLVAGVAEGGDAGFGNPLDVKAPGADAAGIVSKIARLVIGGSVVASGAAGASFGIVAQYIGEVQIGGDKLALDKQANGQVFAVIEGDGGLTVREVAL
jgi:hypothetical protein